MTDQDGLEHIYGPVPEPTRRQYPPAALVAALEPLTLRQVARMLNVDPSLLCRPWSHRQADRHATRLGLHPVEVWGAAFLLPEVESTPSITTKENTPS